MKEKFNVEEAYLGFVYNNTKCYWSNGDTSSYEHLSTSEFCYPTPPPATVKTTSDPSKQRVGTSLVIIADSSKYSTKALTSIELNFASMLAKHISDRGPVEMATYFYGCNNGNEGDPSVVDAWYPGYAQNMNDFQNQINYLLGVSKEGCQMDSPLSFYRMIQTLQYYYYGPQSATVFPPRRRNYGRIAVVIFSSNTNSSEVIGNSPINPVPNSPVITISVGNSAASLGSTSVPQNSNYIRLADLSNLTALVEQVDARIFSSSFSMFDTLPEELCWFMKASDPNGDWYPSPCSEEKRFLCQTIKYDYIPPPTENTLDERVLPCEPRTANLSYFLDLGNTRCYKISTTKRNFSDAEQNCFPDSCVIRHSPQLVSITSELEMSKLDTMAAGVPNEAMFWIGLKFDNAVKKFTWVDGSTDMSYDNWRKGYPRIPCDGCECVAYVVNDGYWINTDCSLELRTICYFDALKPVDTTATALYEEL
ncbi:hypothetical protein WR25_10958 isoform B [Diploscapter pachys]|nr:hypothetical protein WR25_10958 isoform B [Diploscapter pachys]